jgi:hypothetical protein
LPHFTGGVRRLALIRSRLRSRHNLVASTQHARHHDDQPLLNRRFGRNAENGRNSLHRLQRRPFGGGNIVTRQDAPRWFTAL